MTLTNLKINSELSYYEIKYKILSIDFKNQSIAIKRSSGDGETVNLDLFTLITDHAFKPGLMMKRETEKGSVKYRSILDSLKGSKREKVSGRFELIKPLTLLEDAKCGDTKAICEFLDMYSDYLHEGEKVINITRELLIERIAEKNLLSTRTIKRYLAAYKKSEYEMENHGEEGLIPRSGTGYLVRKDNKKLEICHPKKPELVLDVLDVRIDEKYIPIIKDVIEQEYLTVKKISPTAVYDLIETRCIIKKIDPPKKITIYKLLSRIDPKIRQRMREGKSADEEYNPVERGFSDKALYPLHIVELDHTELDMDVIDDKSGLTLGCPWITLGIDVYSREVWCMYISFEPPSANRVRKAIFHGICMKRAKERYGSMYEWEAFGKPSIIMLDNGPDFKSVEVRRMINETLKSNVRYRPVTTPRYGATIERLFGIINSELIHRLDGTRKSNPEDLGEYKADEEAIYTIKDIEEILANYITDVYHRSEHKGLPPEFDRPSVMYLNGLCNIGGIPDYVDEGDEEKYNLELLPTKMKPYTRDGIRLNNVIYRDDRLSSLISSRSKKYKIKYDIDDISKIYLLHPSTNEYYEVLASNPSYEVLEGVNSYTYKRILEMRREQGKVNAGKVPGTDEVAKNKARLQEKLQKKIKSNRTARQQAKRMNMDLPSYNSGPKHSHQEKSLDELFQQLKRLEDQRFAEEKTHG